MAKICLRDRPDPLPTAENVLSEYDIDSFKPSWTFVKNINEIMEEEIRKTLKQEER